MALKIGAIALSYPFVGLGFRLALNNVSSWWIINEKRDYKSAIAPNGADIRVCSLVGSDLNSETEGSSLCLAANCMERWALFSNHQEG